MHPGACCSPLSSLAASSPWIALAAPSCFRTAISIIVTCQQATLAHWHPPALIRHAMIATTLAFINKSKGDARQIIVPPCCSLANDIPLPHASWHWRFAASPLSLLCSSAFSPLSSVASLVASAASPYFLARQLLVLFLCNSRAEILVIWILPGAVQTRAFLSYWSALCKDMPLGNTNRHGKWEEWREADIAGSPLSKLASAAQLRLHSLRAKIVLCSPWGSWRCLFHKSISFCIRMLR